MSLFRTTLASIDDLRSKFLSAQERLGGAESPAQYKELEAGVQRLSEKIAQNLPGTVIIHTCCILTVCSMYGTAWHENFWF